jgi:23S rRNA (guanosine2251-2'-O)-methyltransferase
MIILEGALSVKAAIESKQRKIHYIWMDKTKESKDFDYIKRISKEKDVKIQYKTKEEIDEKASGKTHGGLIAFCEPRVIHDVSYLLKNKAWFVVLIEGVEDPFNLGQMIRTAYASGATAVILSKRDWSSSEVTLMKSSAGCYDRMQIITLNNLDEDMKALKEKGYHIAITHREDTSVDFIDYDYPFPLLLAFGGELRGLSRSVIQARDVSLKINYPTQTKVALNAVSACAIVCFEVYRKRKAV